MKLAVRLVLICVAVLCQSAWADTGPYYVSYPGYCNIKKVYINVFSDVYGTEVGCSSSIGAPLVGSFTVDGKVIIAATLNGQPCVNVYGTDGTLNGGCSNGGSIAYSARSTYRVQETSPGTARPQRFMYNVSSEMPDLEKTKDLPSLP